jgi:5-methylcytosine-specific restriction endonuclease McrA
MSRLGLTRDKIYKTVARQLHGVVPCWVCGQPVSPADATLEHIKPLSEGGNSHLENLAISHAVCNRTRPPGAVQSVNPCAPKTISP